jgi:hypothetical protein
VALATWCVGVWEIYRFSKIAGEMRYQAQTLSESFQIRQIILVLNLLKPLAMIFFCGTLIIGACLAFQIFVLWHGYNEHAPSYKAAANVIKHLCIITVLF